MKHNLRLFLDNTALLEGVYSNSSNDSGGETCYGISRTHNPQWGGWIILDNLKCEEGYISIGTVQKNGNILSSAEDFYKKQYWDKIQGDDLPSGIDLFVADTAVNQGVHTASICLQRSCGVVDDGVVGKNTLKAASGYIPEALLQKVAAQRMKQYMYIEDNQVDCFGLGWANRFLNILSLSQLELSPPQ